MRQFGGAPWSAIARKTKRAVPRNRRNYARSQGDLAHSAASLIRDVKVASRIQSNAGRLVQLSAGGQSAIAAVTLRAISGNGRDDACGGRDFSDCVVPLIGNEQVAD